MTATQTAHRAAEKLRPMVDAYIVARAHAEAWRARMDDWTRAELAAHEYHRKPDLCERYGVPERITEPGHDWMMDDDDYAMFSEERQAFVDSLNIEGLKHGHCPALVAESYQRYTADLLLKAAADGEPGISAAARRPEHRDRAVELLCGLVVNQPGYGHPARVSELEVAREFFRDPAFRGALSDAVAKIHGL